MPAIPDRRTGILNHDRLLSDSIAPSLTESPGFAHINFNSSISMVDRFDRFDWIDWIVFAIALSNVI
ncbi:hypothetical protein [Egbenema bharatensis]|uniref:hypothetical protein n=1 Tax=Egbenema bharatensis TaxID=3463334 RepID=UPI003A889E21